jgi:hypothetical protein
MSEIILQFIQQAAQLYRDMFFLASVVSYLFSAVILICRDLESIAVAWNYHRIA